MKKLIVIVVLACMFTGCKNKTKQDAAMRMARQATIDSVNYAQKQQRIIDSLEELTKTVSVEEERPAMQPIGAAKRAGSTRRSAKAGNSRVAAPSTPAMSANTVAANTSKTEGQPAKKKGLNNAAKGAIIGLGTGAAAGAVIGKENRGKGAIVGGIIGAIGGAVGGAVIDKSKAKKAKRDSLRRDSLEKE